MRLRRARDADRVCDENMDTVLTDLNTEAQDITRTPVSERDPPIRCGATSKGPHHSGIRSGGGCSLCLPAVLFFAVFAIFPILFGSYLSLTRYNLLTAAGLCRLQKLPGPVSRPAVSALAQEYRGVRSRQHGTDLDRVAASGPGVREPGSRAGQSGGRCSFLPVLPPLIVVAVIWKIILHPNGMATAILSPFTGLGEIPWLTDPVLSRAILIMWSTTGR